MCVVSSLKDNWVYLPSLHLQDERPSLQSSNACYTCIGAPVRDMLPNFGRLYIVKKYADGCHTLIGVHFMYEIHKHELRDEAEGLLAW